MSRSPAALLVSSAFGALMVAAAAQPGAPWGLVALALTAAAVLAGLFFRPAATVAVLLSIASMALGDPAPLFAAVSGLSAAVYLLTTHGDPSGAGTLTAPTVAGMVGFTLAGAAATAFSLRLTWIPLLAPVIMAVIVIIVAAPLVAGGVSAPAADSDPPGGYE